MPRLTARFFGFPHIEIDGVAVKIERRKTLALLAYLMVNGNTVIHGREGLAALFWPELSHVDAMAALRHGLWEINHELGESRIDKEGREVRLHLETGDHVDVLEFQALVEKGKSLGLADPYEQIIVFLEAVALYRGDFLSGFTLKDCPDFDRWQFELGEQLRDQFAAILSSLAQTYRQAGEHDAAIACARRWLALDPLNEAAHRVLMQCYDAAGQRLSALRQYDDCTRILKKELGIIPEQATRAVYEQILTQKGVQGSPLPAQALAPQPGAAGSPSGASRPVTPPPQSMPPPVATPFVGRQEELRRIFDLLSKSECRLVTLVGPGGIGKTRIAIQIAGQFRDGTALHKQIGVPKVAFPDGVHFVPLADATSSADMLKRIANAIGCPFREGIVTPAGYADNHLRIMHFLSAKKCLLVLDNLEQLEESSKIVFDILTAAPILKILATSRRRLNISPEWLVELSGMPVPGYKEKDGLQAYSSVQLFLDNASRASSSFAPDSKEIASIGRICQLVDGIPLGIELAAAWVRTFACQEIAAEIERNLDFLYSTTRGVPERHQSLRAAFEYSWRLLPERERSVLRRLSVFRGGFTREIAARVAGATLPLLTSLLDHSLLRRDPSGRYELHEILKQYAREKLANETREEQEALNFHSESYLDLLIETGELLKKSGQAQTLHVMDSELENFLIAWDRAVDFQRTNHLLESVTALILYFETSSQWARGREVFSKTLHQFDPHIRRWLEKLKHADQNAAVDPDEENELAFLAIVISARKRFAQFGNVSQEVIEASDQEALEMVGRLSDRREKAYASILLSIGSRQLQPDQVISMLQQNIRIFENELDVWGQAIAWLILADFYNLGLQKNKDGWKAYANSLERFRDLGNDWGRAVCYNGLGSIALREGKVQEARSLWAESVSVFDGLNNIWRKIDSRTHLAEACEKASALEEAIACTLENVEELNLLGERSQMAGQLYESARLELLCGKSDLARIHHRQALGIFHQLGDLESAGKIAGLID